MKRWLILLWILLAPLSLSLADDNGGGEEMPTPIETFEGRNLPGYFKALIGDRRGIVSEVENRFRDPSWRLFPAVRSLAFALFFLGVGATFYNLLIGGIGISDFTYVIFRLGIIAIFLTLAAPSEVSWDDCGASNRTSIPVLVNCAWGEAYRGGVQTFLVNAQYEQRISDALRRLSSSIVLFLTLYAVGVVNQTGNRVTEGFPVPRDLSLQAQDNYLDSTMVGGTGFVFRIVQMFASPITFALMIVPYMLFIGMIYLNYLGLIIALLFLPISIAMMAMPMGFGKNASTVAMIILAQILGIAIIPLGINVGSLFSIEQPTNMIYSQMVEIGDIFFGELEGGRGRMGEAVDEVIEVLSPSGADDIIQELPILGFLVDIGRAVLRAAITAVISSVLLLMSLIVLLFAVLVGLGSGAMLIQQVPAVIASVTGGSDRGFRVNTAKAYTFTGLAMKWANGLLNRPRPEPQPANNNYYNVNVAVLMMGTPARPTVQGYIVGPPSLPPASPPAFPSSPKGLPPSGGGGGAAATANFEVIDAVFEPNPRKG